MSRVEVPDWPLPIHSSARRKVEREHGTHRAKLKEIMLSTAQAMGAGHGDAATLVGLARAATLLDELTREAVADQRTNSYLSWAQVGAALGVSKQAAQQRYGAYIESTTGGGAS